MGAAGSSYRSLCGSPQHARGILRVAGKSRVAVRVKYRFDSHVICDSTYRCSRLSCSNRASASSSVASGLCCCYKVCARPQPTGSFLQQWRKLFSLPRVRRPHPLVQHCGCACVCACVCVCVRACVRVCVCEYSCCLYRYARLSRSLPLSLSLSLSLSLCAVVSDHQFDVDARCRR